MKGLLIFSAVASASLAAALDAQVTAPKADSGCTNYPDGRVECRVYRRGAPGDSLLRNRVFYRMDSAMAKRAALGLELRTTGTRRDTLGVFVEAVTPKGPAETAGIIEGDLLAVISEHGTGAPVTLRVYSGGRFRDVQLTAGKASDVLRLGRQFNFGMPRMMEFGGPGTMMFGPEMEMMRDRMPMIRTQLEPLLRQRLNDLPRRIQLRTMPRMRTMAPVRVREQPFIFDDTFELDEPFAIDFDEPFEFENEIEPVSPEAIRELAATAILDARVALRHLAADGIA